MSNDPDADALKTRIATSTQVQALDPDEAQTLSDTADGLPPEYVLVYLSRRSVDNQVRMGGTTEPTGRRLTTRPMAKSVDDCRLLEQRINTAFQLNPITLSSGPVDVRWELGGGDFDRDDQGYYFANTDWIFVL